MRLGELKKILDEVVDSNNKIVITSSSLYNGQLYIIQEYSKLIKALSVISEQSWIDFSSEIVEELNSKFLQNTIEIQINPSDYNSLTQFVNKINAKLPLFYGILDTIVEKQDEQIINIKLPTKEDFSLDELSDINKRLSKIFSTINIDGTATFSGFDKGSSWYEILIGGALTYKFFISALKIAQEFFKAEKNYYEAGEAKIHYQAALLQLQKEQNKIDEEAIKDYAKHVISVRIENSIKEVVKELPSNGHTENEVIAKMSKTVEAITTEMNNGLEFHLSLNPPEYAEEDGTKISIDYEVIRQIQKEHAQPKALTNETTEGEDNAE
ncbi:MAG: hypothetical protein J6V53_04980 [Alphaproteobacteria bacterium]|nr:hypothetical protein [Alphaproteobacteria bacterium]